MSWSALPLLLRDLSDLCVKKCLGRCFPSCLAEVPISAPSVLKNVLVVFALQLKLSTSTGSAPRCQIRLVFRDQFLDGQLHLRGFLGGGSRLDRVQSCLDLLHGLGLAEKTHDLGMRGRRHVLGLVIQLLVEFFTRAQARELDLDVGVGIESAQFDQLAGQVDDFHGMAHIENKNLAAFAQRGALEDETDRLIHGHEIAGDVRVRDGCGHMSLLMWLPLK